MKSDTYSGAQEVQYLVHEISLFEPQTIALSINMRELVLTSKRLDTAALDSRIHLNFLDFQVHIKPLNTIMFLIYEAE